MSKYIEHEQYWLYKHKLIFKNNFNQPVDNLPQTLTKLTFGFSFNKSVDNLPQTLTNLTFGGNFNKPVDNLPCSLTDLTFGDYFNQPVDNLPCSLTDLTFGGNFNQTLDNLPIFLIAINLSRSKRFNKSLNSLPNSIEKIILSDCYTLPIVIIPHNFKILICSSQYEILLQLLYPSEYKYLDKLRKNNILINYYEEWNI
jgi:hypothetical protein